MLGPWSLQSIAVKANKLEPAFVKLSNIQLYDMKV